MHDSELLNRVTSSNDRIYLIVKVVVRLSHPAYMELVLRKRLCINIYNSLSFTSLTGKLKQKITGTVRLTYVVIAQILQQNNKDVTTLSHIYHIDIAQILQHRCRNNITQISH